MMGIIFEKGTPFKGFSLIHKNPKTSILWLTPKKGEDGMILIIVVKPQGFYFSPLNLLQLV